MAEKLSYTPPKLVEFGSVRNLTGGSQNSMMDGDLTNTLEFMA